MKPLLKLQLVLLVAFGAVTTASGASVIVTIPAAVVTPWVARVATNKNFVQPACDWQVITAKKNNFVCAKTDVDWSRYEHIVVTSVDVAPANLKKPLTEKQTEQLRKALAASMTRQFGDAETGAAGHTLNVRATITGVERSNIALNIISLAAIQAPLSFGSATMNFELADGDSGETLAELTLRGRGRVYEVIPSVKAVGHAQKAAGRAPKQVGQDIDALRHRFGSVQEAEIRTTGGQ